MPVKVLPFTEPSALARAMHDYIDKMVNPPLTAAMQDFLVFGTGAMEFTDSVVRHVPLEQLHIDRPSVLKVMGQFPGLNRAR